MPFTLFLARIIVGLLPLFFVAAGLGWTGLTDLIGPVIIWGVIIGVPVVFLEALGVLNGAAKFFFGGR